MPAPVAANFCDQARNALLYGLDYPRALIVFKAMYGR